MSKFDFSGWATKNDVLCSDGTTIRPGCFDYQDGEQVPLMWMHQHHEVGQVLGHCVLEARPEGMRINGKFNDTEGGRAAKGLVLNGDVNSLSIYANKLTRNGGDILHGAIKEVSLVIGGADPTARIDTILAHGEESEDEAIISGFGSPEIYHDDTEKKEKKEEKPEEKSEKKEDGDEKNEGESEETVKDVLNSLSDKQKKAVGILIEQIVNGKGKEEVKHAESQDDESDDETVEDVINSMSEKQRKVVDFLIGKAVEAASSDEKGEDDMKHNVFEGEQQATTISHADVQAIFKNAKKLGSMRAAIEEAEESGVLQHDDMYGIMASDKTIGGYAEGGIDYLFPDAKTIGTTPEFIKRNTDWVEKVLGATHRTPFARVKSIFADITEDEARAKGYIKGHLKKDEVFSLLKRVTGPQTIYKKQKFDKDDIEDITDFNVVAWVKTEMQMMLREEIARAVLIGDGRLNSSNDKIHEENIRPVYNDSDLFTVKVAVEIPINASDDVKAKALERAVIKSRKLYKGSGNPSFYTTEDELTNILLRENGIGEKIYKTEDEVRTALRAKEIVTVEAMENKTIAITESGTTKNYPLAAVSVNLADYNIGTNGGAKTDFFDDFDIDYNQYKYLYETRMSGALIKPFAAISFYYKEVAQASTQTTGD